MALLPKRRGWPRWLPQVAGYCLSAGCLAWVLHGYPIKEELIPAIRDLDWKWVALAVVADLSVYVAHAWRWNTLLEPVSELKLWRSVQAIYIGLFANEVLPLRAGELIRCYLLAHWNNLRISLVLASGVVERLVDGVWMVSTFLITLHFVQGVPKNLTLLVQAVGLLVIAGAAGLAWVALHKHHAHSLFRESRWAAAWRHVIDGLHLMSNPATLMKTVGISFLYLLLQVLAMWALMKAYRLDLSFWSAGAVLAIIRFWTIVPNAPGNIGLVNVACISSLRLLEVEANDAKTFSIIYFAAVTTPLLFGGGLAVALTGLSVTELRDRAKRGLHALHAPPGHKA